MALVFIDFDGTLTHFNSFFPYCLTAFIHRPERVMALPAAAGALVQFAFKERQWQQTKETLIAAILGGSVERGCGSVEQHLFAPFPPAVYQKRDV